MQFNAIEHFRTHAFVDLGKLIDDKQLREWRTIFDDDQKKNAHCWRLLGGFETRCSCDILVTFPEIDAAVRHPHIFPLIEKLVGDDVCFEEISLRHIGPFKGAPYQSFHRDNKHLDGHPLRIDYLQLMIYLTDVGPGTHCFSISPESAIEPILETDAQLKRRGIVDLHGPAGTCVLFNSAALHTATIRQTDVERKSIQIYYGHLERPCLSHYSSVPAALWRNHADRAVEKFYGKLNQRTRQFAEAFGAADCALA